MASNYKGLEGMVYLGKEAHKYQQLVYASTLYGTFFTVYGTFKVELKEPSKIHIKSATFRLKNYKGVLDLGLRKVTFDSELQEFTLKIKALKKNKEVSISCFDIDPTKQLKFIRKLDQIGTKKGRKYVHDDEFYYRDGDFKMKRPPYDLLNDDNCGDIEKCIQAKVPYEIDPIEGADFAPGARCMMSELKVLI